MEKSRGLGKHEEMVSGWGTGSMGWTGFPFQGRSSNTLGVEIAKSSDSLVL